SHADRADLVSASVRAAGGRRLTPSVPQWTSQSTARSLDTLTSLLVAVLIGSGRSSRNDCCILCVGNMQAPSQRRTQGGPEGNAGLVGEGMGRGVTLERPRRDPCRIQAPPTQSLRYP